MLKNYIWDLDGTLLDSYGSIVSSLREVAGACGAKDSSGEILRAVKQGAVSAYLRDLSGRCGRDYQDLYGLYREISHDRMKEITLIPGARETLEKLRRAGCRHFVYTHRGKSTEALLTGLGLNGFFTETVTFEYGFRPKPSGEGAEYLIRKYGLKKSETAYVGDRSLDVGCAKDAGIRAILYCPGGSVVTPSGEEDRVIERLEELTLPEGTPPA